MDINFQEAGDVKISGHIGLGAIPTLNSGTWNGRSLDELTEGQLRVAIGRMLILCNEKFPREG